MATSSSGFVAALTVAAVATVGFLGWQASANVPAQLGGKTRAGTSPSATASGTARARRNPTALPGGSGSGARVVYAVGADRVWLVGAKDRVRRTFAVTPGNVDPAPGPYTVTSRSHSVTGTDGTPIEHVVRFAFVDGVAIGFSAAVGKARSVPEPVTRKTGGIRESRADGTAMWGFATIGRRVVVVP